MTNKPLSASELASEMAEMIGLLGTPIRKPIYKTDHLSLEFVCTPCKFWTFIIAVYGDPLEVDGAAFTYNDIVYTAVLVCRGTIARCQEKTEGLLAAVQPEAEWN